MSKEKLDFINRLDDIADDLMGVAQILMNMYETLCIHEFEPPENLRLAAGIVESHSADIRDIARRMDKQSS